jgi:hypothetical protein
MTDAVGRPSRESSLSGDPDAKFFCEQRDQVQKRRTLGATGPLATYPQRVLHSRFFGASSVASALDLRLGRDPDANGITLASLLHCSQAAGYNNYCPR